MTTKDDVLELVKKREIEFIRIEFLDYAGVTRGRTIRPSQLKSAFEQGVNFSTAIMSFDMFDEYIPDPTFGPDDGDFFAVPDPATFAILPYRKKTARMLCDLVDIDGQPWPGCPRNVLKQMLNEVEEIVGGTLNMAFEQEAYLLKEVDGKIVPADQSHCFSTDGVDVQEDFVQDFVSVLEAMNVTTEQVSSEYGPGQLEINLRYTNALKAADDQVTFMHVFKQLARDKGMIGTLMPKPFQHLAGSGLHVHMSLFNEKGDNLFADTEDERGLDLSETAYQFIGGLLKHGMALVAIGAPSVNSYKRMQPGSWAPAHLCYGMGNRSVLIRVVDKRRTRRFEYRGADGTCNPYLLAASLIAAGLQGVYHRIDPGDPAHFDVGHATESELHEKNIKRVPKNLNEALTTLQQDTILAQVIGPTIWNEFIKIKQTEWDKYVGYVSEWELGVFSRRF
ncbi:glutamine synthetase family protein [Bacillus sp. CGMCC 1.16541]|uniref:glutamine synthetase family protein n=1 Tax=Bacillus sp. CGMCC 1.16541 TaxID=2185143 RepID=UPI000D7383E1|nr:glutamine synthetase family protein [Bacillus sp. CGMCC 1.16541]